MEEIGKTHILGVEYTIYLDDYEKNGYMKENNLCGYALFIQRKIVVADASLDSYPASGERENAKELIKQIIRHEIVHAFLNECGLRECTNQSYPWAINEEMIDWIALMAPKMLESFKEANAL